MWLAIHSKSKRTTFATISANTASADMNSAPNTATSGVAITRPRATAAALRHPAARPVSTRGVDRVASTSASAVAVHACSAPNANAPAYRSTPARRTQAAVRRRAASAKRRVAVDVHDGAPCEELCRDHRVLSLQLRELFLRNHAAPDPALEVVD